MQARNMTDLQGNGLVLVYDNTAVKSNKKKNYMVLPEHYKINSSKINSNQNNSSKNNSG